MVAYCDPKTKKAVGIRCDLCNKILTKKFEYLSVNFDMVEVDCVVQRSGPKSVDERLINLDICTLCYNEIKERVLVNIRKREKEKSDWTTST